jgi:hypothetical protein
MNRRAFLTIAAGVSIVTGLGALLFPAQLAAAFGVTLDDTGTALTRLLGAAYIGYAAIAWAGREVRDHDARRAIAVGNLVSWGLSLAVIVIGIATGLAGTQAWLLVVLAAAFTVAWGYVAFGEASEAATA